MTTSLKSFGKNSGNKSIIKELLLALSLMGNNFAIEYVITTIFNLEHLLCLGYHLTVKVLETFITL